MAEGPADASSPLPEGLSDPLGEVTAREMTASTRGQRFRECSDLKAVVAFEESAEEVEGHYFYIAGEEYRVIRLDSQYPVLSPRVVLRGARAPRPSKAALCPTSTKQS
jgi:hypothetical protein